MKSTRSARQSGTGPNEIRDEAGFALVMVLLALVGMTLLASAGYLLSNTDYRINQSHRAATQAFYVADAGLEAFMGTGKPVTTPVTYTHAAGTAEVWATKLVDMDSETAMYRVTSRGRHAPAEGGSAQTTISKVAIFKAAPFDLDAAFTAPPGLHKNGVSGTLSGHDAADWDECGLAGPYDVAGVAVPPGGLEYNGGKGGQGGGGGDPPGISGDPAVDQSQESDAMLAATKIPWTAVRSGSYASADYVYPQDAWPNFGSLAADDFPLVIVDESSFSVGPTESGRGTLVVTGDLVINGSFSWDGVVLVGGTVTSNGNNTVLGAVVGGLNLMLGEDVDEMQLDNGTWKYQYHSCNVLWALKAMGTLAEEPGTWAEGI